VISPCVKFEARDAFSLPYGPIVLLILYRNRVPTGLDFLSREREGIGVRIRAASFLAAGLWRLHEAPRASYGPIDPCIQQRTRQKNIVSPDSLDPRDFLAVRPSAQSGRIMQASCAQVRIRRFVQSFRISTTAQLARLSAAALGLRVDRRLVFRHRGHQHALRPAGACALRAQMTRMV